MNANFDQQLFQTLKADNKEEQKVEVEVDRQFDTINKISRIQKNPLEIEQEVVEKQVKN